MSSLSIVVATSAAPVFTLGGLPLHPLVVHVVVVLLPLSVIGLIAVVLRSGWRQRYGGLVMMGLVLSSISAVVAKQAGEQLAPVTGVTADHQRYGTLLTIMTVALTAVALVWWWSQRTPRPARQSAALGAVAILLGALTLIDAVLVGHSGASMVWKPLLAANGASAHPSPSATASATSARAKVYTMADVRAHGSASDCWTAINGEAYNLTTWINQHPGGPLVIRSLCGRDGSAAFTNQHGGQSGPESQLAAFALGPLG